jgi:hypothetical protein
MYYVYEYIDPRNMKPFYVGKGKGDRKFSHLKESEDETVNLKKWRKINKILSLGLEPIINIIVDDIQDEDTAYLIEEAYILKYGRKGFEPNGILTNICLGARPPVCNGERNGMFNKKHTEESLDRMRKAKKGQVPWNLGIPREESVKLAISIANTGNEAWNKGQPRSDEDRQRMKDGWERKKAEGYTPHNKGKPTPKTMQCEHCGQMVAKGHHTRYHGPNCKSIIKK